MSDCVINADATIKNRIAKPETRTHRRKYGLSNI